MDRLTQLKRGARTHIDCDDCPWVDEDPPKCDGHHQGPVACDQRPDRDRFAKPEPLPSGPMTHDEALDRVLKDETFSALVDRIIVMVYRKRFDKRTFIGAVNLAYRAIQVNPDSARKKASDAF